MLSVEWLRFESRHEKMYQQVVIVNAPKNAIVPIHYTRISWSEDQLSKNLRFKDASWHDHLLVIWSYQALRTRKYKGIMKYHQHDGTQF